jgi:predicted negative regulator of RcsB-dependent stress response
MKTIALIVAVIAAVAAAGYAWQRNQALEEARASLASANAQLQKTQTELRSASAEVAPLRKESAEQKSTIDQQRAELAAAKAFLDSERASTARVREELAMTKEQMAFMSRSRAAQATPGYSVPMMVRPTPTIIRVVPSTSGTAEKAPMRAQ